MGTVEKKNALQIIGTIQGLAFPEYNELAEARQLVDDCLAGQKTIKSKEKYLPPNEWQKNHKEQYFAFLRRALFPGETRYALDIYEGLFSIGEPRVVLPKNGKLDYILKYASVYNDSLKRVQLRLNSEQMSHGLRCLLVEIRDDDERPFFIREYSAEKFLRSHFRDEGGESFADFILIDESTGVYDLKTKQDSIDFRLRVFALDENGEYYQRGMSISEFAAFDPAHPPTDERTIFPEYKGKRLNRIPFVWCGVTSLSGSSFDYPPLQPMADTEIALYVAMANHSQHIYMNTQEILVFTGVSPDAIPKDIAFGCGSFIALKEEQADAKYVSTNGVGYTAEKDEIEQLKSSIEQKRLSIMSAKSHQSGTVVGMEQNSRSAPLRSVVETSGAAITEILKFMAQWMKFDQEEIDIIRYSPSLEFAETKVNLSEFVALCKSVMDGEVQMLEEDLYLIAKNSGYINASSTWEEFKAKYKVESSARQKAMSILPNQTGNPFARTNQPKPNGNGNGNPSDTGN